MKRATNPAPVSVPSEGPIQYSLGEDLAEWQRKEVRRLRAWNAFDWCLERLLWAGIGMALVIIAGLVLLAVWLRETGTALL